MRVWVGIAGLLGVWLCASAQPMGVPKPSRTAYKCVVAGKVTYSDEPCVGAERLDLQPSRGLDGHSGRERVGPDVRREKLQEAYSDAVRPLTGESNEQMDRRRRRFALTPEAKRECASLDRLIAQAEGDERIAASAVRADVQDRLFAMRSRYRQQRC